ncbi:MAG: site-2 protease family protein [Gammaproteobacteria bacterium]|jgi:Zn-dependent protease/predicted transcriptional regulator
MDRPVHNPQHNAPASSANDESIFGTRQFSLFNLFGFQVKLDISWFLLALLITWTLAAGLFPYNYPDLSRPTYWWMGVASAIGIFFSIVFHEFSHSLVARRFGMPIKGITLFIFGGVAEMHEEPPNAKAEFLMAVAGPIASFVLAAVFFQLYTMGLANHWYVPLVGVLHYLSYINLIVAIFNLVPAFPLDGGRMLRAGLWQWQQNLTSATRLASQIGSGFGILLIVFGILNFIQGNFIGGMWIALIGMFLRGAAAASYRQVVMRELLQGEPVRRFMNTNPVVIPSDITVRQLVEDYVYKYHFKMFPVVDGDQLRGCITTRTVRELSRDQWDQKQVKDLLDDCSPENTVSPDTDTSKVLSVMMRPGAVNRLLVVENNQLAGILSLTDLKEYIALKMDLEPPR